MDGKINKSMAIAMVVCCVTFAAAIGRAADDPFKKEQGEQSKLTGPALKQEVSSGLVSVEVRMIEMPRLAADEVFKEQGGMAKTYVLNEKTLGVLNDMIVNNKAKIVVQSKIITQSGIGSVTRSSRKIPVPAFNPRESISSNKAPISADCHSFQYVDIGTALKITPIIDTATQLINCEMALQADRTHLKIHIISDDISTRFTSRNGDTVLIWGYAIDQDDSQEAPIILVLANACIVPAK